MNAFRVFNEVENVYAENENKFGALHLAASIGNHSNIKSLRFHWSYLFHFTGHVNVTRVLIKNGANVNVEDNGKQTPLHKAAFHGNRSHTSLFNVYHSI